MFKIKNLKNVEHFLCCSPLVKTWYIIVKVLGLIICTHLHWQLIVKGVG